jgi:5-formyltetrahydrofolate cyclo-ligase
METDLRKAKVALRKQIRGVLQKIPPAARNAMSAQIRDRLKESAIWKNAGAVLFFAPLPDEPDVWPLLEDALADKKLPLFPALIPLATVTSPVR